MKLSREARETIRNWRGVVTIAGYVSHNYPNGEWGGDACGCFDDRCRGYHHDLDDRCGCLPECLDQYYLEALAPFWWVVVISGNGKSSWIGPLGDGEEREIGQWLSSATAESARTNWEKSGYQAVVRKKERHGKDENAD